MSKSNTFVCRAAAEAEARRRRAEDEARRAEERRQQEAAEKAAEEAHRKKEREDEEARRKRQAEEAETERRRAETEAERQRAERETAANRGEEERKAKEQAEARAPKATGGARQVKVTDSAARGERERLEVLRSVKESVRAFEEAPAAKKVRQNLGSESGLLMAARNTRRLRLAEPPPRKAALTPGRFRKRLRTGKGCPDHQFSSLGGEV